MQETCNEQDDSGCAPGSRDCSHDGPPNRAPDTPWEAGSPYEFYCWPLRDYKDQPGYEGPAKNAPAETKKAWRMFKEEGKLVYCRATRCVVSDAVKRLEGKDRAAALIKEFTEAHTPPKKRKKVAAPAAAPVGGLMVD